VYPMPISRYFTLQLPQNFTEAIKINLLNANGQFTKTLHSNSVNLGQQEIKLDIGSKLNPGIYFLQINSSNHSEIIQIIIQ
ncbi:MAG: T9SS type A sorting domain-containing protein, partial [Saprospiraceae bacterium]